MATEEIAARWPSTTWGEAEWFACLEARPDIYEAILGACAHVNVDTVFAKRIWRELQRKPRPRYEPLPKRVAPRWRVLHGLAYGLDIATLATSLRLSRETVRTHLHELRRQYDKRTTAGLVPVAIREIEPELPPLPAPPLSPAPHEILLGTALGMHQKGIATCTGRSWRTVKTWRATLHGAFEVQHSVGLVSRGFSSGALAFDRGSIVGMRDGNPWTGRLLRV